MWPTIDRARRRLSGNGEAAPAPEDATPAEGAAPTAASRRVEDVVIVLGPIEVDQLRAALELLLGSAVQRPNTPRRIEHALALLLDRRDAPGTPRVLRRPAGVSTPEAWEIHLDGVDRATGRAVREAGRTGVFAA